MISSIISPSAFEVNFNNMVSNISEIIRESRHMPGVANKLNSALLQFKGKIDDANFIISFMTEEAGEDYVRRMLLDFMDIFKDTLESEKLSNAEYRVVNSIYDIMKEFYFDEV